MWPTLPGQICKQGGLAYLTSPAGGIETVLKGIGGKPAHRTSGRAVGFVKRVGPHKKLAEIINVLRGRVTLLFAELRQMLPVDEIDPGLRVGVRMTESSPTSLQSETSRISFPPPGAR